MTQRHFIISTLCFRDGQYHCTGLTFKEGFTSKEFMWRYIAKEYADNLYMIRTHFAPTTCFE